MRLRLVLGSAAWALGVLGSTAVSHAQPRPRGAIGEASDRADAALSTGSGQRSHPAAPPSASGAAELGGVLEQPSVETNGSADSEESEDDTPSLTTDLAIASGDTDRLKWFVLPIVGYNADIGFGGALLGLIFRYVPGYEPYRDQMQAVVGLSSTLYQAYQLTWERVGLFDKPLRLILGFEASANPVGHYCGEGNLVRCDEGVAENAAIAAELEPGSEAYADFIDRYYRWRALRFEGWLSLRWSPIAKGPELVFDWRGQYTIAGYIGTRGNYSGSLFDQDHPDGENGFRSELKIGLVFDRRDSERRPTQGYLLSAAMRAAGIWIGSEWDYFGLNVWQLAATSPWIASGAWFSRCEALPT